jgi:carboxymethylenebutenolidase
MHESRRGFLITKLSAGFAAAVLPVSASTITTDTNGLTAGEVQIPVEGGTIPAYRAMPAATGKEFPCVLVVQRFMRGRAIPRRSPIFRS